MRLAQTVPFFRLAIFFYLYAPPEQAPSAFVQSRRPASTPESSLGSQLLSVFIQENA
jgi:hypothetical protein